MNDHRSNEHFKQRRAEIEMYNAGVDSGIRFSTQKILEGVCDNVPMENVIQGLIKAYHD